MEPDEYEHVNSSDNQLFFDTPISTSNYYDIKTGKPAGWNAAKNRYPCLSYLVYKKETLMKQLTIIKTGAVVVISFFILLSMGCDSGSNGTRSNADNAPGIAMSGITGPETIDDNVVVPRNTITTFNGTTVKGNVTVQKDAQFFANGARIEGNVQAYGADLVDLNQETFIDGDVQGEKTRSVIVRDGTLVGGNVQITEAAAPDNEDSLLVENATVNGDVQAEKSSGRIRTFNSLVFGNLQFVENKTGPYEITGNDIDGDLQFFKNQGAGVITGNQVGGNLQSKENNPQPTISGNSIDGDLEIE